MLLPMFDTGISIHFSLICEMIVSLLGPFRPIPSATNFHSKLSVKVGAGCQTDIFLFLDVMQEIFVVWISV